MAGTNFWDFQQNLTNGGRRRVDAPSQPAEKPLTVSQLTARIDRVLKAGIPGSIAVRGEVSNYRLHGSSGHAYFTLKDASACIDCVMFRSEVAMLRSPADGLELIATGRLTVYGQRGKYQIQVSSLEPLGQGALELARRQIQQKLEAEGLFDLDRKRPLPRYPRRIVLVTSTGTAAVQDMLKVLRRFSFLEVAVYHVPVQGDGMPSGSRWRWASPSVAARAYRRRPAGQGAGRWKTSGSSTRKSSFERSRAVGSRSSRASGTRSTSRSPTLPPTTTRTRRPKPPRSPRAALADGAGGDRRRRVPPRTRDPQHPAAARQRLAQIERHEAFRRPMDKVNALRQRLDDRQRDMTLAVGERVRVMRDRAARLDARLRERHPRHLAALHGERLAALSQRLDRAVGQAVATYARRIDLASARLHCISPQEVLKRGYSLTVNKKTGRVIRDPAEVKAGEMLVTRLANGQIESRVEDARQMRLFEYASPPFDKLRAADRG